MTDTQLRDLARAIAEHLDGFRIRVDDDLGRMVWLDHPDGRRLHLHRLWNNKGRLEISGGYPPSDYYFKTGERASITVSATREPAAIAKDVTRRLLPGYVELLGKVRARIAEKAADDASRAQIATRLAAAIPGASIHPGDSSSRTTVRWYSHGPETTGYGHIELYGPGTTVTFEARSLPIAAAERLAAALSGPPSTTSTGRPGSGAQRRSGQ